jgi:hypothetical protein
MHLQQPESEYFSRTYKGVQWINPSSFKNKSIQTPYDWWYKWTHPDKDTSAKSFGQLIHAYFLENKSFTEKYFLSDISHFPTTSAKTVDGFPDMRNTANKMAIMSLEKICQGKQIIEPETTQLFHNVKNALENIRDIHYLLDPVNGKMEYSFYCFALFDNMGKFLEFVKMTVDEFNELPEAQRSMFLPIKIRVDYNSIIKGYILDIKVTKSVGQSVFPFEIEEYGYHIQAAMYLDVVKCVLGRDYDTFIFLCAGNVPPFHSIKYIASERMIQSGREDYIWKLEMIYKALKENSFPGLEYYSEIISYDDKGKIIENRQIITIDLPDRYYYQKLKKDSL